MKNIHCMDIQWHLRKITKMPALKKYKNKLESSNSNNKNDVKGLGLNTLPAKLMTWDNFQKHGGPRIHSQALFSDLYMHVPSPTRDKHNKNTTVLESKLNLNSFYFRAPKDKVHKTKATCSFVCTCVTHVCLGTIVNFYRQTIIVFIPTVPRPQV